VGDASYERRGMIDQAMTVRSLSAVSWRALLALALSVVAPLAAAGVTAASASAETTWLCKPGLAKDPCLSNETATVEFGNGSSLVEHAHPARNPPIDCFYVYPTVSGQATSNSNLKIEPGETQVAINQASRFSQVCRVYSPMYRQLTIAAEVKEGGSGAFNPKQVATAYAGVLSAWHEYLARYNHGRGVVLIGHSQGAGMLRELMKNEIDPNPAQRRLLVSALLMGGNVSVPAGGVVGGDFQHIPACQAASETHCVIAYSSFLQRPPADTLFGVVEGPVATLGGGAATGKNLQVLCVNPTLLVQGDQAGPLLRYSRRPYRASSIRFGRRRLHPTPWVATPGLYSAQCRHESRFSWLQVTHVGPRGDPRELLAETLGPTFGLHLEDINLALGNLVGLVGLQSASYQLVH
jgi:Protein of unknown function (DUF3089)